MLFYVVTGAGPGDWYPTEASQDRLYVGTLGEAASIVRQIKDPHYRNEVLVTQVNIETDKANVARLLNQDGGYETKTGLYWARGPRGGLQSIPREEVES